MDAPNAPNPANPNEQDPADQNQDQVPVGPAPTQGPIQIVSKCTSPTNTTTSPCATSPCWCHAHSSDYLSTLDRKESGIFR